MEKKSNKIIHYIWFGGNPLSDLTKKCIQEQIEAFGGQFDRNRSGRSYEFIY